jgi:arylsulfatase A-like enzyme
MSRMLSNRRRRFLQLALSAGGLGLLLAGLLTGWTSACRADQPPNIILCMGDDHGWEETGYNGHPFVKTPVLDEMAATGLRLDRFYSASPVCSPTRGSVMTGRHPNRYGTFSANWSMRPEEITLAELLHQAGYACAHFGKWHLGPVKADSPTNPGAMGFDHWLSHDNFFEMNPVLSLNGAPPQKFSGESSQLLVDHAAEFIRQSKQQDQPFLVVLWFGSPHEPYSGLESDLALYNDLPAELKDRQVRLTSMETGSAVRRPLRDVLRERYAEITAMDRAIGNLRDVLADEGLREQTVLWYCGDNGLPASAVKIAALRGRKGQVYEGGVLVPGIIEWPAQIRQPRTSQLNAVTSDILPTVCQLVGAPLPNRPLDGISLEPLLTGEMKERPTPICFWNYDVRHELQTPRVPYLKPLQQQGTTPLAKRMGNIWTRNFRNLQHPVIVGADYRGPRAILDNRFKLVVHDQQNRGQASLSAKRELFDLETDPAEKENLVDRMPDVARDLEQQLHDWQRSVLESLTGVDYRDDLK